MSLVENGVAKNVMAILPENGTIVAACRSQLIRFVGIMEQNLIYL